MPRRWASRLLLLSGLFVIALAVSPKSLAQQPGSVDKVTFRDRTQDGKIVTDTFEIKESSKGVEIIVGGKTKSMISPADIVKIDYGSPAGINKADQLKAMAMEDTKNAVESLREYSDLVKKATAANAPEKTRRFLLIREAQWMTKIADTKMGEDFKTEASKALEKWLTVKGMSKKSWEIWPVARTAARLQIELGKYTEAAATLQELGNVADLPKELQFEAKLAEAAATLRADRKQGLTVEGALDAIEKDKDLPTGPLQDRLKVLKAVIKVPATSGDTAEQKEAAGVAITKLRDVIEAAKDPVAKAVGYNFLGDSHMAYNQFRDAQWAYLWVDTVFNQDVDERVIACRKLIDIFDLGSDEASKERAIQFKERLPKVR